MKTPNRTSRLTRLLSAGCAPGRRTGAPKGVMGMREEEEAAAAEAEAEARQRTARE